jgi:hypothetical protein
MVLKLKTVECIIGMIAPVSRYARHNSSTVEIDVSLPEKMKADKPVNISFLMGPQCLLPRKEGPTTGANPDTFQSGPLSKLQFFAIHFNIIPPFK